MGGAVSSVYESPIEPLVRTVSNVPGQPRYSVACFEGSDWSLKPLQKAGDQHHAPELAARIERAVLGLGAHYVFAPSPALFNAKIIRPDTLLQEQIKLGRVVMYRNPGAPADGTWLPAKNNAGVFSAAGCSMIVATLRKEMIFAHAGRDCVIDRTRILTRGRENSRHHESIVDTIVAALAPIPFLRQHLHVSVYYSIKPEDFLHSYIVKNPEHLSYNNNAAEMLQEEYGRECGTVDNRGISIDIPRIIRAQFIELAVPEANISLEHAYLADELPTTRRGGGRYLAAVVRHS